MSPLGMCLGHVCHFATRFRCNLNQFHTSYSVFLNRCIVTDQKRRRYNTLIFQASFLLEVAISCLHRRVVCYRNKSTPSFLSVRHAPTHQVIGRVDKEYVWRTVPLKTASRRSRREGSHVQPSATRSSRRGQKGSHLPTP